MSGATVPDRPEDSALPGDSAVLGERLRRIAGVSLLVPRRAEVRDVLAHAATALSASPIPVTTGALGTATGGTPAEPVLVRVTAAEVSVSVDVGVTAEASAPDVARAVGGAIREWSRSAHPDRQPRVAVRIVAVD